MGDDIKLVTIGGRKMWDCGDRLLPLVAGADGEGGNGDGKGGEGGSGEGKSSMVPEGEEGKGEGGKAGEEGKGGEDKRTDAEKAADAAVEKLRSEMTEREQKLFDKLADASGKQLKNALKDLNLGGDKAGDGKAGEGDKGGKGEAKPDPEAAARAEADQKRLVRDSRAAFKEILGDDVRFLGNPERDLAMTLGHGLIVQAIGGGEGDDEVIGRAAAETVAKQIREARKFYEARTKAGLKRDGLLLETPGQTTRGATQPQADGAFNRGAEIAKAKYGPKPAPAGAKT